MLFSSYAEVFIILGTQAQLTHGLNSLAPAKWCAGVILFNCSTPHMLKLILTFFIFQEFLISLDDWIMILGINQKKNSFSNEYSYIFLRNLFSSCIFYFWENSWEKHGIVP